MRFAAGILLAFILSILLVVALYGFEFKLVSEGMQPEMAKAVAYGIFAVFLLVALHAAGDGGGPEAGA